MRFAKLPALLVLTFAVSASATTYTVNSTLDEVDAAPGNDICATALNQCTLRAAVQEANAHAGPDAISLPVSTFRLSTVGIGEDLAATGDLDITQELSITGAGMGMTVIDGLAADRVFEVTALVNTSFSNLTIINGNTTGPGGGIFSAIGGSLTVSSVAMSNNSSVGAGALYHVGGTLSVTDSVFDGNVGGAAGGAILHGGDFDLNISGSDFTGNFGSSGGAIYTGGISDTVLTDCDFSSNQGLGAGGALFAATTGTLAISGSTFTNNFAIQGGGIFYAGDGDLTISNSQVTSNVAVGAAGGGIFVALSDDPMFSFTESISISQSTISSNVALSGGAGIFSTADGATTLANVTISNNSGGVGVGGGISALIGLDFTGTDLIIENNSGSTLGGGAYLTVNGSAFLTRVAARGNTLFGAGSGGGILMTTTLGTSLVDVTFEANSAGTGGLGGGLFSSAGGNITGQKLLFYNNHSGGFAGGGYISTAGTITLENSTVSGNNASQQAGGLYLTSLAGSLKNVTFAENSSAVSADSLFNGVGTLTVSNSIFANALTHTHCSALPVSGGNNIDDDGSCALAGAGDAVVDPLLDPIADNGGFSMTHALKVGSPAIDAFTNNCPITDQRDVPRPFDGNQNGTAECDKGAFEYNDACPDDPDKQVPGTCGCGVPDNDDNANTITDCLAESDLSAQLTVLKSLVNKLKPVTSAAEKKKRKAVKDAINAASAFVTTWLANITLSDGAPTQAAYNKVKKAVNKARKVVPTDPTFADLKKAAKSAISKFAKKLN